MAEVWIKEQGQVGLFSLGVFPRALNNIVFLFVLIYLLDNLLVVKVVLPSLIKSESNLCSSKCCHFEIRIIHEFAVMYML